MTDFTLKTLKPSKTEALRFKGRLIAETEWTTNAGEYMRYEIWETQGGAYIPVIEGSVQGDREVLITADVIEPIYKLNNASEWLEGVNANLRGEKVERVPAPARELDEKAMHIAVLRFFEGHNRARSMIRDQLKWNCVREVA